MVTGCLLGSQSLQKLTLPCASEYRCDENSMWDEGEGWSSGQAAAVWSSPGQRARWWLGEGPQVAEERRSSLVKTARDYHLRGTRIQRWSAVGGTDSNTDRLLRLLDSTSHTQKLCVALKRTLFLFLFLFSSRLTCQYLFGCIYRGHPCVSTCFREKLKTLEDGEWHVAWWDRLLHE